MAKGQESWELHPDIPLCALRTKNDSLLGLPSSRGLQTKKHIRHSSLRGGSTLWNCFSGDCQHPSLAMVHQMQKTLTARFSIAESAIRVNLCVYMQESHTTGFSCKPEPMAWFPRPMSQDCGYWNMVTGAFCGHFPTLFLKTFPGWHNGYPDFKYVYSTVILTYSFSDFLFSIWLYGIL